MIRIKTLSLPLITVLASSAALPVNAQVSLSLSSEKTYRQDKKDIKFKGGSFSILFGDGNGTIAGGCSSRTYRRPGWSVSCAEGTNGYVTSGRINGASRLQPYVLLTSLQSAIVVQPRAADRIKLTAAPASKLPRPSGGFKDDSLSVYYNLTVPDSIKEYDVTQYYQNRNYTKSQRTKFEQEVVPGVYQYSFPRLGNPNLPAVIKAVIYPMAEGAARKNNKTSGFEFTKVNENKWSKPGFIELDYSRPNVVKWKGLTSSTVFASVDKVFFSIKSLRNPKDPANSDVIPGTSIFPGFTDAASDSRVQLANPYVTSYSIPPVFPSGTRGVIQVDLVRNFQTGGVTYDFSSRAFQIPVRVVDRYKNYASVFLAKLKKDILADSDGDGYNNLNEWILDSDASDRASIPVPPVVEEFQMENELGEATSVGSYVGFNVDVKRETVPAVKYTLQYSENQGRTWKTFRSGYYLLDGTFTTVQPDFDTDYRWFVRKVTVTERGVTTTQIQVRSGTRNPDDTATMPYLQPEGTLDHIYRVKVTLAK